MKRGRIRGNPVAEGYAGAVMQKPLEIQWDGRTDRPAKCSRLAATDDAEWWSWRMTMKLKVDDTE